VCAFGVASHIQHKPISGLLLGANTDMVGLIEGVGEATASISKLFSGWLSDRLNKRKALTIIGYGLGALSKPLFAIAPTPSLVLAVCIVKRTRASVVSLAASISRRGSSPGPAS
jgi:MFS family permease